MSSDVKRLFFAVELSEEIRRKANLSSLVINGVKPVRREQLHLTLLFLGDFPVDQLGQLTEEVAAISFAPFELEISGSGFFPNARRPYVLWIGIKECVALSTLQAALVWRIKKLDFEFRESHFTPHITLARIKQRIVQDDADLLQNKVEPLRGRRFTVNAFHLFSSKLHSFGAVHTIEASFDAKQ